MQLRILVPMVFIALLGCGSSEPIINGSVTLNHQPLARGYVTFFPASGTKSTQGAQVTDGRFTLKSVPPGDWKVLVSQSPEAQVVKIVGEPATLSIAKASPI
ncbi:MAG TPA: hypothetical protein VFE62_23135, partial [Gemmataceae bacterium]|nr:hypothetical protein [Gemmataceae bacterium]